MTPEQLSALAGVMGYPVYTQDFYEFNVEQCTYPCVIKHDDGDLEIVITDDDWGDWQPHKDLNQALPLLWKMELRIVVVPQTNGKLWVEIENGYDADKMTFFCEKEYLASDICVVILERL